MATGMAAWVMICCTSRRWWGPAIVLKEAPVRRQEKVGVLPSSAANLWRIMKPLDMAYRRWVFPTDGPNL